jgi:hypothetical protein
MSAQHHQGETAMTRNLRGMLALVVAVCALGALALLYQGWQRDQHDRGLFTPLDKSELKATPP